MIKQAKDWYVSERLRLRARLEVQTKELEALREELAALRDQNGQLESRLAESIRQTGDANLRWIRTTEANIALKRKLREHGIRSDGMAA